MENVNIKSAISEEEISDSKQKVNLNDVLNGTVVLPFEDELGVLIEAIENIREIHEDCLFESDENNENHGTLQYVSLSWHLILNKVLNKTIILLKNEIEKTQDENKKITYKIMLETFIDKLERSEKVLNGLIECYAKIMWFGIN